MGQVSFVLSDERQEPIPQDGRVRNRLLLRLYASKHTHRLMPAPVALVIAAALEPPARRHRNPAEQRNTERFMKDLLLYTPRASEAPALARRHLREKSRVMELMWRPWLLKRSQVLGKEHWEAAHADGRGCVVVIGHFGGFFVVPAVLARHGLEPYVVASPHYWQPMSAGRLGLMFLHVRREYGEKALGSSRLIASNARPERLIELLESGASVVVAFDVPGSAATPFLGRSVALSGGPATLSLRTGAKVVPVIPERHGSRIDVRMLEPLDPADYRDLRSLRTAIARTFERVILEKPEIVDVSWYPPPLVTEALTSQAAYTDWQAD